MPVVNKLKFGVEGFTEASRRRFHKVASNEKLVDGFRHIFEEPLKKAKRQDAHNRDYVYDW